MGVWRIRYVSDGGPVSADNAKGWPAHSKKYSSLLSSMRALRDVLNTDPRVGTALGVALQFKLAAGEPWCWVSKTDTNKYAKDLGLEHWRDL